MCCHCGVRFPCSFMQRPHANLWCQRKTMEPSCAHRSSISNDNEEMINFTLRNRRSHAMLTPWNSPRDPMSNGRSGRFPNVHTTHRSCCTSCHPCKWDSRKILASYRGSLCGCSTAHQQQPTSRDTMAECTHGEPHGSAGWHLRRLNTTVHALMLLCHGFCH